MRATGCAILLLAGVVEAFTPTSTSLRSNLLDTSKASYRMSRNTDTSPTAQQLFKWSSGGDAQEQTDVAQNMIETKGMPDLIAFLQSSNQDNKNLQESSSASPKTALTRRRQPNNNEGLSEYDADGSENSMSFGVVFSVVAVLGAVVLGTAGTYLGVSADDILHTAQALLQNPQQTMSDIIDNIEEIGPAAPFFYGLLYCIAEILAVPATPLTLSAGYLFGLSQGVAVVLAAGTIAACVGFFIGKTALRGAVEGLLDENPEFRKLDKAIGKEGFKLLFLVRLTPIFPFALSNYIYGASAIKFWPYFWGTLLGFTPGTIAYVYSGMVGQTLMSGESSQPWYYYAAGMAVLGAVLKYVTDTATSIVKTMEEDMDD